ncbi:MAG: hypothetical protein IPM26_13665 [Saprospiraceae bacterium]|nr:hypothetical protein [Saprospiraceae bacterium]
MYQSNRVEEYLKILSKIISKDRFYFILKGGVLNTNSCLEVVVRGEIAISFSEAPNIRKAEYITLFPHVFIDDDNKSVNVFYIQHFESSGLSKLSDRLIYPERSLDSAFKFLISSEFDEIVDDIYVYKYEESFLFFRFKTNFKNWIILHFGDEFKIIISNKFEESEILKLFTVEQKKIEIIQL